MKKAKDLLSNNLSRIREQQGFTQPELAEKAGLSPKMIQKIEYGQTNPSTNTLDKLSHALGVPLTELFAGGMIPAEHYTSAAHAANKQLTKGKRARAEAQMLGARGKRVTIGPDPADLAAGFEFVSKFANQERDIQLTAMALVYEQVDYLSQLSPAFCARLVQLLSAVKK